MFKNRHILFEHLFYFNVLFYIVFNQKHSIIRGFIKRREAGIFPFYSGMFPLLLLINLYRVYKQILSNHPPTLP